MFPNSEKFKYYLQATFSLVFKETNTFSKAQVPRMAAGGFALQMYYPS